MSVGRCIYCNEMIPEEKKVCNLCGQRDIRVGTILQSQNATKEEVAEAYNDLSKIPNDGE